MLENVKALLILNPVAGKGKSKKISNEIKNVLSQKIKNLVIKVSEYPGHTFEIGKNAAIEGYDLIISVGGDGTLFEIINGIYSRGIPDFDIKFGIIPAGTGNSFLRDFGDISPENSITKILKGEFRRVDLVEFVYNKDKREIKKYYFNMLGIGLIAEILELTNERLKFFGSLGYSLAVLLKMFKRIKNRILVWIDGKKIEYKDSALVISNSKYTGGKMKVAPMAETDDGKVDVIVFNEVNRIETIDIFVNVFKGTHINHQKVKVLKGSEIRIESSPQLLLMADGELLGETPLKLKVLPQEFKMMI